MKKRIVYSLLIIFLLMTTVVQSLGAVLAVSATQGSDNSEKTSQIIDSSKAITQVSGSSQLRSSSQSIVQSSSEQQTSKKSESKKSSEKKETSKKQVKSVLIKPRAITDTDYKFPDFSKTLSSQKGVITVNYDSAGNAHTSVSDGAGTLTPDDSYNEIPYPNNAFPVYIPGVSTETIYGKLKTSTNYQLSGEGLDGDKDYIYYTKIMAFRDENGKQHWVDVKQKFMGLEKHGWYNDWSQYKAQGYRSTNLDDLMAKWSLGYGLGSNTNQNRQGLFGIGSTFQRDAFKLAKMTSPDGGTPSNYAKADGQYRQAAKVRLEFYDNETGKPITISGFFTVADLDHRDFLQFSKDSNIQGVYVTNNTVSNNTLKGTFNPASDPSTVIVNNIGNNEYTDRDGHFANNGGEWGNSNEVINPDNTDAWATVTFHQTQSVEYAVSDWQRMDFLPTALVPVAFSAPWKSGDGDEWNQDWDDNDVNYNVVATLPYRGSTIKNPQHGNSESGTISTFHPTEKFELTDPVNKNLKVNKVTIMQNGVTDVTANFDIDTTGNKVTAKAKADFLGKEDNYAKTYNMKIETSVASDADLGSLPTMTATDDKGVKHTYAKIANTAHLDVVKVAGATEEGWDSNEAFGHVKVPDAKREVQDLKQYIKLDADTDWTLGTTGVTGHRKDKVNYKFAFTAKTSNSAGISDAEISDIKMAPDELTAPTNVKVKIITPSTTKADTSETVDGTATPSSDGETYSIKIDKSIKAGQKVEVTFNRTVNDDATIDTTTTEHDQTGKLTAASLTTPIADKDNFNLAKLKIEDQPITVTDLKQTISNTTTPANDKNDATTHVAVETSGKQNDIIQYTFTGKAGDNTDAIKDLLLSSFNMNKPNEMSYIDDSLEITIGSEVQEKTPQVPGNGNTVKITSDLPKNTTFKVTYQMKVVNDVANTITNDAKLSATNLKATPFNTTTLNTAAASNTATIKQFIKNRNTAGETWKGPNVTGDKAETSGVPGNIIDYKFAIAPGAKNSADLLDTALKDIAMKESSGMTLVNPEGSMDNTKQVKVTVDGVTPQYISGNPISANAELNDVFTPLTKGKGMTIEYSAKINDNAGTQNVTNDANFYASNLTGDMPATSTVADKAHKTPANKSILHIVRKDNVTIKQELKQDSATTFKTTETGVKGDTIDYRFMVTAGDDNSTDIKNIVIDNIVMDPAGKLDYQAGVTATLQGTALPAGDVVMSDGTTAGTKKITVKNVSLSKTQLLIVNYKMKITADMDGDVKNDGLLTADSFTDQTNTVAADKGKFNTTVLTLKKISNKAKISQSINLKDNVANTNSGWIGPDEPAPNNKPAEATVNPGDTVTYKFSIKFPTTDPKNNADLLNSALQDIAMNVPDDLELANVVGTTHKIQISYRTGTEGQVSEYNDTINSIKDIKNLDLKSPLSKNVTEALVYYGANIMPDAKTQDVTNAANFYASNLTGDLKDTTVANYQNKTKANQSILHIVRKDKVTISQQLKQDKAAETAFGPKASGTKGDTIDYRFKVTADKDNNADVKDIVIDNIVMDPAGKLDYLTGITATAGGTAVPTANVTMSDGTTAGTKKITLKNVALKKSQVLMVNYKMKVTADMDGDVNNDGLLTANGFTDQTNTAAADKGKFNTTTLTLKKQKNTATIQQFIRNPATAISGQAWFGPGYGDGKAETTAVPGDEIMYRFDITLPTDSTSGKYTNDEALTNAAIQDITMNVPDDLELVSLDGYPDKQIQISYGSTMVRSTVSGTLASLKAIALKTPLDADKKVMVKYQVLVKDNAKTQDITNDANFYADNLTGDLTDKTVANYQHKTKANQSKLKIRNKKEVKLEQTLKNTTTEDTSTSTDPKYPDKDGYRVETTAGKGDVIDYRYKVTAAADNTGNITNMKVNTIMMKKSDKLSFSDPDTGNDYPLVVKISKADGTNETTDTNAKFSADHQTITLSQPLKPGYIATISYKMQVTASVDDNTLTADKVVTNDAKLTADELTETKTTSTGTENVLIAGNTMNFNQTILNLKKNIGEIIIRYVDLEDNDLSQPTYIATEVDEKGTSGTKLSTVNSARVAPKVINGYTIHAVTESTDLTNANWSKAYKDDPVFTDKVRTITYGYYKRMLSVEAPSYWDFGTHNRTQTDSTYYLEDRKTPQAVKVTDHYGVDSWQLQVAQEKPFTDDRKQVLKDAELQFKNGTVIADVGNTTPNQAMSSVDSFNLKSGDTVKNLMTYTKVGLFQNDDPDKDQSNKNNPYSDDQGKGSWYYQFGDKKNADISIGLHVPATTKRDNTTYTTTLDWTLTVAP
ncbi:WxL domain-containing protein [Latilactobacillus sakei]|uniref:WxL domain-containing protein n=1 Tax=Latilactobacillus sakei TaxID=1599 RepID=UPI0020C7A4EA|nr:WxL domain-containing protein [Latilactobacillus sakei]MCP8856396.1 WxL domain-containing protein [Latilactobacillus sakei]